MANNIGLSKEAQRELVELAGKKLGIDAVKLQQQLADGSLEKLLDTLGSSKADKVKEILSDRQQLEQVLNSPGAREILKKYMK